MKKEESMRENPDSLEDIRHGIVRLKNANLWEKQNEAEKVLGILMRHLAAQDARIAALEKKGGEA
jgi:hypothetical protein